MKPCQSSSRAKTKCTSYLQASHHKKTGQVVSRFNIFIFQIAQNVEYCFQLKRFECTIHKGSLELIDDFRGLKSHLFKGLNSNFSQMSISAGWSCRAVQ